MKYIVIAIPGASDHPNEGIGGKTPFEAAKIPNLQELAKTGRVGTAKLTSDRLEPSSDVSLLNLLGYDAGKCYTGRGPIEAANLKIKLEDNEVAFRMNFVTEADGVLADATAGNISTKEARALVNYLNKKVANDFVRFYPSAEYRHVAVLKDAHGLDALSASTVCPEDAEGQSIEGMLPKGPGDELLKKMMSDARLLLQDHEINQVRVDLQENPANMIWLWGQGGTIELENFKTRYGLSGALLASMEYAVGLGKIAGLKTGELNLKPVTADENAPEYDFSEAVEPFQQAIDKNDFVCLNLEACDEASRKGDYRAKVSALEGIDFFILSKVCDYMKTHPKSRVLITSCHTALWQRRKHLREAVPFVMSGAGIEPDDIEHFSESSAKASNLHFHKSAELIGMFLGKI